MPDVTLDLGNQYIGSAYSPQVAITETETGHEIDFTFADSEHPGQTKTEGFEVPNYAYEEAEREAAEAERAAAESARVAAEEGRMNRELDRVFNENARINAEELREDAETARASAEQARAAAETARASAEGSRASAEQARTSAESARASAEAGRAQAESDRVSAEQARATAETARASAEAARENAEATRQANTTAAIARADAATAAANTATADANAATTAAQAATGEAETATDAANAAAALATAAAETITDAYFPMFTAGAAEGITGGGPTDTAAWTYRACPGTDGPATIESIHGRTVRWNQLNNNGRLPATSAGISISSNGDGSATISGTSTSESSVPIANIPVKANYKYLIKGCPTGGSASTFKMNISGIGHDYGTGDIFSYPSDMSGTLRLQVANGITFDNVTFYPQLFDLTTMFGAGNEPSTVAEFEALYPEPYYPYDAGSLLSVQMEGIETVGFNQWDEEWELGTFNTTTGADNVSTTQIRAKNLIPVLPNVEYYCNTSVGEMWIMLFDADKAPIAPPSGMPSISGNSFNRKNNAFTTTADARYMRFYMTNTYGTTYNHDICINLSWSGYRNGEYEPYWQSERTIPAATYFPNGMRSAGTVYDELTSDAAVTRVGAYTFTGNETVSVENWHPVTDTYACLFPLSMIPDRKAYGSGAVPDAEMAELDAESYGSVYEGSIGFAMSSGPSDTSYSFVVRVPSSVASTTAALLAWLAGKTLYYALATPTTQPIDPPLNLSYRVSDFGTERIVHTDPTAAPTLVVAYGSTADGIRDRALACIARIENGLASANYGVGTYLIHGGTLCRVTTAIAAGEAITIGTNVVATTVMAELLTLTQ